MSRPATAPVPLSQLVPWMLAHAEQWQSLAGQIGLSPQQADEFKQAAGEAQAFYTAALEARAVSRSATQLQNAAIARALRLLSSNLSIIRGFAGGSASPAEVFSTAQVDPPARPSPAGLPALPTRLRAALDAHSGAVVLTWRATNPAGTSGTSYMVSRALIGADGRPGAPAFIGTAPAPSPADGRTGKSFVDTTLPTGAALANGVCYAVAGVRGGLTGPAAEVLVRFGNAAAQGVTVQAARAA